MTTSTSWVPWSLGLGQLTFPFVLLVDGPACVYNFSCDHMIVSRYFMIVSLYIMIVSRYFIINVTFFLHNAYHIISWKNGGQIIM